MISSELRPVPAEPQPEPEVLSFGPRPANKRVRHGVLTACLAVVLAVAGFGIWSLFPHLPDFSADDLDDVYSGMVRGDGTNEVFDLARDQRREAPTAITPESCLPLFYATLSNQFPPSALDGVSTYWVNAGNASISLMTYRYPDSAAAQQDFKSVTDALKACADQPITTGSANDARFARQPVNTASQASRVAVQPVPTPSKVDGYASFVLTKDGSVGRFSTDVLWLDNTVTWQYRYDYGAAASYSPQSAQELMTSLLSQMRSVQEAHA